ncbi:4Fe-4S dicluster domain-containing protein [Azospirillum sp.]|uniref:4Fe-4S dicluster domain-containing protein n=1 Tax=Azospirillum sp. TaxID=34012 RepID=UPI003D71BEA6
MSRHPLPPDLAALADTLRSAGGRRFWQTLEQAAGAEPFRHYLAEEFPGLALPETGRREVLRAMAASILLAGLTGCGKEEAVPYVVQPELAVPGRPRFYATAVPFEGFAQPVLAETHEGRPTRLDGNPDHPLARGSVNPTALDAFSQAAVLELYDPDRSQTPRHLDRPATWDAVIAAVTAQRIEWQADGGRGVRLLTGAVTSATLLRQIDDLRHQFPELRWHVHEPVGAERGEDGTHLAFGRPLAVHPRLDQADVIVSLGDDLFGTRPAQLRNASGWAARRLSGRLPGNLPRLLVAEASPTPTGAMAADRLPVEAARLPLLAHALARALSVPRAEGDVKLTEPEWRWMDAAAGLLREHAGRALVTAGPDQPPEAQATVHRINAALRTGAVAYTAPVAAMAEPFANLIHAMADGDVRALLMLEVNPAYDAPPDLRFAAACERVPFRLHAGLHADETAALCHWHAPVAHALESWSDGRSVDGTATIIQPTIRPIFGGRALVEMAAALAGDPFAEAQALVRATWRDRLGDDAAWRQALHRGFVEGTAEAPVEVSPAAGPITPPQPPAGGLELTLRPDPCLWDGRRSNVAWLQELPKPVSKISWDSYAAVSPQLSRAHDLKNGDVVELTVGGRSLRAPVLVQPGQAARSVTLFLGTGRRRAGRVGDGAGIDAYAVRASEAPWIAAGLTLTRTGENRPLVTTQPHHEIAEAEPIRVVTADHPALKPIEEKPPSLYPDWPYPQNAWAMAIDTDLCVGCNACVVACQAENNVPPVGREQVSMGREMLWLRVDSYYEGTPEDPRIHFLPVPCMHCEVAPCEVGCPVNATVHSPDGINEQVYNRCIGTRTCSSYCPYKVRRFNFFEYGQIAADRQSLQYNPDVTVRARGVMEKCTYCIQRIARARQDAKRDGQDPAAIEVRTACQAACPTGAIAFGDKNRADSAVAKARKDGRAYALLEEIGTRPRTTYLARIGEHRRTREA